MTEWVPATEAEAAMRDALRASDQELYFRILARTDLLLPIPGDALADRAQAGWGTWTTSGRTHVLAFTSTAALQACLVDNAGPARRLRYHELAAAWPNLEWWLAVNPGLPIEGYLPAWFVSQLARGDVRLPGRTLAARARIERAESAARARATAAVPGRTVPPDGVRTTPMEGGQRVVTPSTEPDPVPPPAGVSADPPLPAWYAAADRPRVQSARSRPAAAVPVQPPAPAQAMPIAVTPPSIEPPVAKPAAAERTVVESAFVGRTVVEPAVGEPANPDFTPANDVERQLLAATGGRSTDSFLSTLLLAKVLLPVAPGTDTTTRPGDDGFIWRTETSDDETYVVAFTSAERLADHFADPVDTVEVKFAHLIHRWPDDGWSFAVNPGTAVGAKLPGSQIVALASWAAEVGLRDDADEGEPPAVARTPEMAPSRSRSAEPQDPDRPTMMQKTVRPDQVGYYLDRGYDRVSGFVHRVSEVAHLTTPATLIAALGLGYPASPFSRDVDEVHVLRWPAYRPSLYRIPYGGQNEAAMRAMEGWVIEPAPFRGNGFAPGESSDVVAEFKVDSIRLPHGAQLWRIGVDGTEKMVAVLDSDASVWRRVEED